MKKRMLVLLAIGVSFSPSVFAQEAPSLLGERKISQTDLRGADCQRAKKMLPGDEERDQITSDQKDSRRAHRAS